MCLFPSRALGVCGPHAVEVAPRSSPRLYKHRAAIVWEPGCLSFPVLRLYLPPSLLLYFFLSLFLSIFFKAFLVSEIVLFLRLGRELPGEHRCLEQLAAATGFAAGP